MPFWAVVRQARSGIEHVVPLAAATEHKAFYELAEWVHAAGHGGEILLYDCDPGAIEAFDGRDPVRRKWVLDAVKGRRKSQRVLPEPSRAGLQRLKQAAAVRHRKQTERKEAQWRTWREPTWANLYRAWSSELRHTLRAGWLLDSPDFIHVPIRSPPGHLRIRGEEDPAVDWWPINDIQPRIQALRAHGSAAPSLHGFEQRRGIHHTACMLHNFRDTLELRAAVWIGSCLWDLHKERGSPGQSTLRTRLGHDLLHAVVARLREAGGNEWHHATSSVLPATPFVRPLTEMVTPKEHDDYAYLAALQFVWVRSLFQLVRVFHSDSELSSIGGPTSA